MIVVIGSPIGRIADGVIAAGGSASRVALAAAAAGRSVQLAGKTGDDPTADGVVLDLARGGVGHAALLRDPGHVTPLEAPPSEDREGEDPARAAEDRVRGAEDPASEAEDPASGAETAAAATPEAAEHRATTDTIDGSDDNAPRPGDAEKAAASERDGAPAAATSGRPAREDATAGLSSRDGSDGLSLEAADVDLGLRYLADFSVIVVAEPVSGEIIGIVADAAGWAEARLIVVVSAGDSAPAGLPAGAVVLEAPITDPDGAFATLVGTYAAALDSGADPDDAFRESLASDGWTSAEPG